MFLLIWDKLADKYDTLWVQKYSLAPTRKAVINEINDINPLIILDIGCGTGQLLNDVAKINKNTHLFGIDKSEKMIEIAENKNINAEFKCLNVSDLENNRKFDLITCLHSFPYYKNKKKVMDSIYNLLNSGGYCIFAQASVNNLYDKFSMWIIEKTAEKAEYLSKKDFSALLSDFKIIKQYDIKEKWFMPTIALFMVQKI